MFWRHASSFSKYLIACLCLAFIAGAAASSDYSRTAQSTPTQAVSFAVIGDSGTGKDGQYAVAEQMSRTYEQSPFNFVLMLGDNIYSNGEAKNFKKKFELPYAELLNNGVKFYASLGNHDVRNGRADQINYAHFNMGGQRFYSFSKGDDLIEFFALDSTEMDKGQLEWLEKELSNSTARWKVAFFHHPLYSSGKRHGSEMKLRTRLEPLFIRYQVNAVFSGHDHMYERIKPQQGVQYFVQGASGQLRKNGTQKKSALTAAGNDRMHSFLRVQVIPAEMHVEAIGEDGSVLDRVTIAPQPVSASKASAR